MAFHLVGCAAATVPVFEYRCLGKNYTCPAMQSSAFDFFCAACDPDNDNIEGIKKDISSTDHVPADPVDAVGTEDTPAEPSSTPSSSAASEPAVDNRTDSKDSSNETKEEDSSLEMQEELVVPTDRESMALNKAKSHLSSAPISRASLIKLLKADGFSSAEAAYAAENCSADWYKQAEKAAEKHLSRYPFYLSLLVEQLELDGFTSDEAQHGAAAAYNLPLSRHPSTPLEHHVV